MIGEWNTAGLALNDKIMISYDPNNPNDFIEVRELHKKLFLRALCKSSNYLTSRSETVLTHFSIIGMFSALLLGCGTVGLLKYSPDARETLHLIHDHVPRFTQLALRST